MIRSRRSTCFFVNLKLREEWLLLLQLRRQFETSLPEPTGTEPTQWAELLFASAIHVIGVCPGCDCHLKNPHQIKSLLTLLLSFSRSQPIRIHTSIRSCVSRYRPPIFCNCLSTTSPLRDTDCHDPLSRSCIGTSIDLDSHPPLPALGLYCAVVSPSLLKDQGVASSTK